MMHRMAERNGRKGKQRRLLWSIAGILSIVAIWHGLSLVMHRAVISSPAHAMAAFWSLLQRGVFLRQLWITLQRLLLSLAIGGGIGLASGLLAGLDRRIRWFLEPVRWVSMSIPAVVIAVLGMLWFGMGGRQAVFLVSFIVAPVIYVNTLDGVRGIDPMLIEMARTYRLPRGLLITQVYLPGISIPVLSALTLAVGIGVRGIILAELLGAFNGMGHSFSRAWTNLNTPELFAWVLGSLLLIGIVEFALLKPLRFKLRQWQGETP